MSSTNALRDSLVTSSIQIVNSHDYLVFCKFRTVNHRLSNECGRWQNLERENRKCNLWNSDIGDEFHYILKCPFFENGRKTNIKKNLH